MAKSTKEIAQRIDPTYFAHSHWLRTWRARASIAAVLAAGAWIALLLGMGKSRAFAAGPVSPSHALFEAQCNKCHVTPFSAVRDESCRSCHTVKPHVRAKNVKNVTEVTDVTEAACASCHPEHRESTAVADGHCNSCHEPHKEITTLAGHPERKFTGLDLHQKFTHATHLKPDLLMPELLKRDPLRPDPLRPDVKEGPLACASCHVASGKGFLPMEYEARCERCHPLGFDVDAPEARAPHALKPAEQRLRVEAFYLAMFRERSPQPRPFSPVPGRSGLLPPEWDGELKARGEAAMRVLEARCSYCHEGDGVAAKNEPAAFSHAAHATERCESCHAMGSGRVPEMPAMASCRECHRSGGATVSCADCHAYHR